MELYPNFKLTFFFYLFNGALLITYTKKKTVTVRLQDKLTCYLFSQALNFTKMECMHILMYAL